MRHRLVALVALALLLAAVVIGNATAAPPPLTPAQAQAMGQDAASGQRADTTAGSGQYQPSNQSVLVGGKASFEVAVFGAPPIDYQWTKNGTNLFDDTDFSGATNRILILNNARATDAGTYSVVVSNALGSVRSVGSVLMVLPAPIVQTISRADGTVYLTWAAEEQKRYQLQYRTNLITGGWSNLGGVITALGSLASASDLIDPNAQRFYRVMLLP